MTNPNLKPIKTDPDNKFRNDQNNLYSKELFVEFNTKPGVALYTLKDHDYKGCLSLKQLYLDCRDTTEYSFATRYFDNWKHWENLAKTTWLSPYVAEWRKELTLLLESEAIAKMRVTAEGTSKEAFAAQKYLADRYGKKPPERSPRGRPTKAEISQAARTMVDEANTLEEEARRVLGTVN